MTRSIAARLALLAVIWGCSFLFIKVALEGLSPAQVVLGRMSCGAAVLLVVLAIRRQRFPSLKAGTRPSERYLYNVSGDTPR